MLQEIAYTIHTEKAGEFKQKLNDSAATLEKWESIKRESQILDRNHLIELMDKDKR